ncbi:lactam utilization protein LamB [Pseudohyphozyma bogoriensis]|nr:lactam utilization protein LamB [Pseudohyphozyma bogoriensis]
MTLDATLNCDCGESFGSYIIGDDENLMPLIDMANIACGEHGGDWDVMAASVKLAKQHGVKVGAHPSLPDRQGFGRREIKMAPESFYHCLLAQTASLQGFLKLNDMEMHHLKPHGCAFLMSAKDLEMARQSAKVAKLYGLPLVGLAGSQHEVACNEIGVELIPEWYADLYYNDDASLIGITRGEKRPPLTFEMVYNKVKTMIETKTWLSASGKTLQFPAHVSRVSICVHGDLPGASDVAKAVRAAIDDTKK